MSLKCISMVKEKKGAKALEDFLFQISEDMLGPREEWDLVAQARKLLARLKTEVQEQQK